MESLVGLGIDKLPILTLTRDVTKHLKRGHRWIFANCFDEKAKIQSGPGLLQYKNEALAIGVVQADTQLRFRVCFLTEELFYKKNNPKLSLDQWARNQWKKALNLRQNFDPEKTNSFRLINGEGDGMPGLIVDIYANTAVIKHDHSIMEKFWNQKAIAQQICQDLPQVQCVYLKRRNDDDCKGENLIGALPEEVIFKENGILFSSNIRDAAKTGFFLDQRDNRLLLSRFSKNLSVLNLFCYTGGFSLLAAAGGAKKITSVDIAKVAIENVKRNFELNYFSTEHKDIAADAFQFVEEEIKAKHKYDLVITDPPSFAPNEKAVPQATNAYIKIFADSLKLVEENGLFAASSCSSHIHFEAFLEITREAFSKARRRGTLVYLGGQPTDHPYPLAMEELRYLKFALFRVD